jgi:hypothetical protein
MSLTNQGSGNPIKDHLKTDTKFLNKEGDFTAKVAHVAAN